MSIFPHFNQSWWPFPKGPSLVKGDGDGTVNIRSLEVFIMFCHSKRCLTCCENLKTSINQKGCLKWKGSQKHDVHHKVFKGINHVDMLRRGMQI